MILTNGEVLTEIDIKQFQRHETIKNAAQLSKNTRALADLLSDTKDLVAMHTIDLSEADRHIENTNINISRSVGHLRDVDNETNISISFLLSVGLICALCPLGALIGGTIGAISGIGSGAALGALHYKIRKQSKNLKVT